MGVVYFVCGVMLESPIVPDPNPELPTAPELLKVPKALELPQVSKVQSLRSSSRLPPCMDRSLMRALTSATIFISLADSLEED